MGTITIGGIVLSVRAIMKIALAVGTIVATIMTAMPAKQPPPDEEPKYATQGVDFSQPMPGIFDEVPPLPGEPEEGDARADPNWETLTTRDGRTIYLHPDGFYRYTPPGQGSESSDVTDGTGRTVYQHSDGCYYYTPETELGPGLKPAEEQATDQGYYYGGWGRRGRW